MESEEGSIHYQFNSIEIIFKVNLKYNLFFQISATKLSLNELSRLQLNYQKIVLRDVLFYILV